MARDVTTSPSRCAICDSDRVVHASTTSRRRRTGAARLVVSSFSIRCRPPEAFVSYAETEYQGGLYSDYVRAREMKLEHFRQRLARIGTRSAARPPARHRLFVRLLHGGRAGRRL